MIRAILLDDNKSHLRLIEEELKKYSKVIQVIGTYTTSIEAIQEIMASKPDVLFLDVKLKGTTGYAVAAKVKSICKNVIYVTNHPETAALSYRGDAIFLIDKNDIEEFLPEAIAKLMAKLEVEPILEIKKLIIKEQPYVEFLLFNGQVEKLYRIKLDQKNYRTLRIFAEVQKGISKEIKEEYIHPQEHFKIFINLYKYKIDFIEAVNKELAINKIKFSSDDFFQTIGKGQYTLAIPSNNVDLE